MVEPIRGLKLMIKYRCTVQELLLVTLLSVTAIQAASDRKTDVQRDGLSGPVMSVSTKQERTQVNLKIPDGPGFPVFVACPECEYDQDGHRTKSGLANNPIRTRYIKDSTGKVIEQINENEKGEPGRRLLMGPFGPTEEQIFADGHWHTQQINRYDEKGNVLESVNFDPEGSVISHREATFDDYGMATDDWLHGANNSFSWHMVHTYDRKSKFESFTSFREDGSTAVTFTVQGSKVLSYWQSPDANGGPGSFFMMDTGPKSTEVRSYNADGRFGRSDYIYLDDERRNISRAEIYDTASELKATAEYEYDFDAQGNWVKRTVKVWTPALGQSEIYEVDYRSITYW